MSRPFRFAVVGGLLLLALPAGAGAVLETQDPFCGACHTQPEFEYLERSLTSPSDLASAHAAAATGCIDCHSGPGVTGRLGSLAQGASDLAAYLAGGYAQPAVTTHPIGDRGCTKCHEQPRLVSDAGPQATTISHSHYHYPEYTAEWAKRQPAIGGSCTACHPAHVVAGSSSQGYRAPLHLNASCEACHLALSGWVPPVETS
jgi:hypothetical protein